MKGSSVYRKKQQILKNLRGINERAGVEPCIADLVEAYARLRLDRGATVDFYDNPVEIRSREIKDFIVKNSHLDSRAAGFLSAYFIEMKRKGLKCVFTAAHLARLLGTGEACLDRLAAGGAGNYYSFAVCRPDGATRTIHAPKPELKAVQRRILDIILQPVRLNPHAEGFRRKRSVVTNAAGHLCSRTVIKMDIKDFFPSITYLRVEGMFTSLGYPRNVAVMLAKLATRSGRLPIGAPTSPAVSNIIASRLDKRLSELGRKTGFNYSRYADDMTFSSSSTEINRLIPLFKEIIREEGFEVNDRKLRILRSGGRQKITGVVVNRKLNVERRERKKLRAVIRNCLAGDIKQEKDEWAEREKKLKRPGLYTVDEFRDSLRGRISFARAVNPETGDRLLKQFRLINWKAS